MNSDNEGQEKDSFLLYVCIYKYISCKHIYIFNIYAFFLGNFKLFVILAKIRHPKPMEYKTQYIILYIITQ